MGIIFSSNRNNQNININKNIPRIYPNNPKEYDSLLEENIKKYRERDVDVYPENIENKNLKNHIGILLGKLLKGNSGNIEERFPELKGLLTEEYKKIIKEHITLDISQIISIYKLMVEAYNANIFIEQISPIDIQLNKLSKETINKYEMKKNEYAHIVMKLMNLLKKNYEILKLVFVLINPYVNVIELSTKYNKGTPLTIPQPENINKKYDMFFYVIKEENTLINKSIMDRIIPNPIPEDIKKITENMNKKTNGNIKYSEKNLYFGSETNPIAKWISYIKNKELNKFIGVCYESINVDKNRKIYAYKSMIKIDKEFQSKRLCKPFSKYVYEKLGNIVDYINMLVASDVYIRACLCYVNAALNIGFDVYIYNKDEKKFVQFTDAKQCEKIKNRTELYFLNPKKVKIEDIPIS